jgi:subtilase family serine protease
MGNTARRAGGAAMAAAIACLGMTGAATAPPAALAATGGGRVALPSPVAAVTTLFSHDLGPAGPNVSGSIRVYLAGRSPQAEARFATAVSTPGNPAYGRYLTPAQFRSRFGSTPAQAAAVEAWARSAGLTVTGATTHYVAVTGTAPKISAALDTSIDAFGSTGSSARAYAAARGMSVPASLAGDVTTVTGLDDFDSGGTSASVKWTGAALPAVTRASTAGQDTVRAAAAGGFTCSAWWGQRVSAIPKADGRTSAPDGVCGYTPQQLRSAYGVSPGSGKGATIAIVLDGSLSTMRADANRFFAAHHLPGFAPGQFAVNTGPGFAASCGSGGSADLPEEPLDVETAHIIAPAAKIVYVAADCTGNTISDNNQQGLLDAETRVVDQHLGDVATESYSIDEIEFSPATAAAWTQVFEQGAAEGIGFDFDSGDGGDNDGTGVGFGTAVSFPASDPWATAVGGTTLEIGRSGAVTGELGWGDNETQENAAGTGYLQAPPGSFQEGSTGGRSILFAQPGYQRGVVPAALATSGGTKPAGRELPDIAADASPITGWLIGYTQPGSTYSQVLEGGTSGASPIVASLEADAKQAARHAIGFANPLLYRLRNSAGIRDITAPARPALAVDSEPDVGCFLTKTAGPCLFTLGLDSSLTEAPGFDDVTGIGAPTDRFIAALARG